MKILKGQTHVNLQGQTTIALDGLNEANQVVQALLGNNEFLSDSVKDCCRILGNNIGRGLKEALGFNSYDKDHYQKGLLESIEQIEKGNPAINEEVNKLAYELAERAKEIEPSLTLDQQYSPNEEGEIFDAGKIAASDPMAFFNRSNTDRPKVGKGNGAFRILINTDVSWYGDPTANCAALMAIVMCLQRQCPVEIWTQQGWMGSGSENGITLFRTFSGGQVLPQHIYFWIGSPHKDSPYSYAINRWLGRKAHGTSGPPEIPCDLYIYGSHMPSPTDAEKWSKWVAATARQMLFDEEIPDGWMGYKSQPVPKHWKPK